MWREVVPDNASTSFSFQAFQAVYDQIRAKTFADAIFPGFPRMGTKEKGGKGETGEVEEDADEQHERPKKRQD